MLAVAAFFTVWGIKLIARPPDDHQWWWLGWLFLGAGILKGGLWVWVGMVFLRNRGTLAGRS
jgi:hypothetical protein